MLPRHRPFFLALMGVLFISSAFAQRSKTYKQKILPGMVKVNDTLYYDEVELDNVSWLEYLHWTKTNNPGESLENYYQMYPDTTVWTTGDGYPNNPYQTHYLTHPAYKSYPLVGVTWKQAKDYCAWRTDRVIEYLEEKGKRDKAPAAFVYRLPTYEEYEMVYRDMVDLSLRIGDEGKKKCRGMYRFNLKRAADDTMGVAGVNNDNSDITAPVKSYWPNAYGIYNLKGNVAEWIAEENHHVGLSWADRTTENAMEKKKLDQASSYVGFRCVCEIIED